MEAQAAEQATTTHGADPLAWRRLAKCRGLDDPISIFFAQQPTQAKEICATCPVTRLCIDYANTFEKKVGWRSGVYGGTTPSDRDKMFGRTSMGNRFKAEGSRAT